MFSEPWLLLDFLRSCGWKCRNVVGFPQVITFVLKPRPKKPPCQMFSSDNGDNALSHHIPFHLDFCLFQGRNKCNLFLQMLMCLKRKNRLKQIQVHHTGWMIGDFFLRWFTLSTDGGWWGELWDHETLKWLTGFNAFLLLEKRWAWDHITFEASDNKGWLYATEISQKAWGSMVSNGWYGHGVLTKNEGFSFGYTLWCGTLPSISGKWGLGLQSPSKKY